MNKIMSLTPEQEKLLPQWRDEWLRVGFCTDPADRPAAEKAITAMYACIGKDAPRFLWTDSPLTAHILMHLYQTPAGASLGDSLRASLGDSLRDSLGASLEASLRDSLGKIKYQHTSFWGQQDAYWIAYYKFAEEIGVQYDDGASSRLRLHGDIARSCMWWWPFENICVVSNRPLAIHLDGQGRLHNPNGAAVEFRDGWKTYAVSGIRIQQPDWIEDKTILTVKRILDEKNAEVRRVMMDIYTPERFIQNASARKVNTDEFGELWQALIPDDEPLVMVRVTNSTPEPDGSYKDYWLRVPPNTKTAREAVAWTFNIKTSDYAPLEQS